MFKSNGFGFSKKDVVSIVGFTGEFVGRFVEEDEEAIVLESPRAFMIDDQQRPFMAPGICASGEQDLTRVRFLKTGIITAVPSHSEIADHWTKMTSGLVMGTGV